LKLKSGMCFFRQFVSSYLGSAGFDLLRLANNSKPAPYHFTLCLRHDYQTRYVVNYGVWTFHSRAFRGIGQDVRVRKHDQKSIGSTGTRGDRSLRNLQFANKKQVLISVRQHWMHD
jgi:hypothetical protein